MPIRNTHKVGDYLMTDDESGLVHYASEMRKDWDGQMRHKDNLDGRHPQYDVKAKNDPAPLKDIRPEMQAHAGCNFASPFIGYTNIWNTTLPAWASTAGIGDMEVDCSGGNGEGFCACIFVVR